MAAVPITISPADVTAAANFLQQFLTDEIPQGDFTAGTALRDLTIGALAAVVAFLRNDATQIRQLQSLLSIQSATGGDPQATLDAATGILSNFFVTPKSGAKARGFAMGHASRQADVFVPTTARFTYTTGLVFVVDSVDTLFVPAAELVPIVDANNTVLEYEFRIPLVAAQVGADSNVAPGLFASFDPFSPYVTRVEVTDAFSGGQGPETTAEVLARAPTAVSVRNLINSRSIVATLDDNFDGIQSILVVGYGDPEMQRDLVPGVAPNLKFHVGGMTDIYLRTGLIETTFTGAVGGTFARPDGVAAIFRDGSNSFAAVEPGDVIQVSSGFLSTGQFMVVENGGNYLVVSERSPFPSPTDEAVPPTTVSYTIGRIGPNYNDVLAGVGGVPLTTGVTSRTLATSGRITLPGGPVMDILDVAIINPQASEAAFRSTLDGFVHFPNQVNTTPSQAATPSQGLQFRTLVHSPGYAQSALQWMDVIVGTDGLPARFDGFNLRVRYRTLASFAAIDSFVRGTDERVTAAFQLPRGHHPVVVGATIQYTSKNTATTTLDNLVVAQTVIDLINGFDTSAAPIDTSVIVQTLRDTYPTIGVIEPITLRYTLRASTGDVLGYSSTDIVRVDPTRQITGPALDMVSLGITDRTLRYVADANSILVQGF